MAGAGAGQWVASRGGSRRCGASVAVGCVGARLHLGQSFRRPGCRNPVRVTWCSPNHTSYPGFGLGWFGSGVMRSTVVDRFAPVKSSPQVFVGRCRCPEAQRAPSHARMLTPPLSSRHPGGGGLALGPPGCVASARARTSPTSTVTGAGDRPAQPVRCTTEAPRQGPLLEPRGTA